MEPDSLVTRFATGPLLLDGPTGTELERRNYRTALPLWTALASRQAPGTLKAVHDDYVRSGADILTACTFRTNRYTLAKQGLASEAPSLTREAVAIARQSAASAHKPVLVAGSVAPLEDCYRPQRTPNELTLAREHAAHVESLATCGVDLLLVETMPTLREAAVAAWAAVATGLPVIVSFLVRSGRQLLDGTALSEALEAIAPLEVTLLSVNCAAPSWCTEAIRDLSASGRRFGAYANSGAPDGTFGSEPSPLDVTHYAREVAGWLRAGATLVGGCCGTGPEHIHALRTLIDASAARSAGGQSV
jgi:S-methylmethionine-dependent homocysteine/selenocysteine methylase